VSEKPILRLANIESSYGPITAIRGISLDLMAGQIVTVLGANGAGKTTILKTISGVIAPQKGSIEFEGRRIEGMEPDAVVRLGISHVPEGREVFPFLSIRDNLRMGAYIRRDQLAGTMSGGEQQMLAMGRALMSRPKVLLLDEPSLGLSPLLVKEIFAIIRRLNVEDGVTILLVEQNARMALETANYGYVLEVGRVVMHDDCQRLAESPQVRESYLGLHGQVDHGKQR
jgi:branched-chain amino acid transport system ATP-binding protein